jgi:tRNA1Val (adenine37-N6)-methyltransferase
MSNTYFQFKQFTIHQDKAAMKVTTDSCILGAWAAANIDRSAEKILDIGSGTGLLMLMIAQQCEADIYGVEKDPAAFEQGLQNIKESQWAERLFNYSADIIDFTTASGFDFIISNPPFHDNQLMGPLPEKNLAHHSTDLTFEALLASIKKLLSDSGRFAILIPFYRTEALIQTASTHNYFPEKIMVISATAMHDPSRTIILFSSNQFTEIAVERFVIKNENGKYTDEFITLMKDYYLHL